MKLIELKKQNYDKRKEENVTIKLNQDELFMIYASLMIMIYANSNSQDTEEINKYRNLSEQMLNLCWLSQGDIKKIEV